MGLQEKMSVFRAVTLDEETSILTILGDCELQAYLCNREEATGRGTISSNHGADLPLQRAAMATAAVQAVRGRRTGCQARLPGQAAASTATFLPNANAAWPGSSKHCHVAAGCKRCLARLQCNTTRYDSAKSDTPLTRFWTTPTPAKPWPSGRRASGS